MRRKTAAAVIGAVATALLVPIPAHAGPQIPKSTSLPTVQITGIVRAMTTVGNIVYATGAFTRARPAGAAPGKSETPRGNLLAFNIHTGQLLPFSPALNGEGRAIAASRDGRRLFVGGLFTRAAGQPRPYLAAFDIPSGRLLPGYAGPSGPVLSLATAANGKLYAGGLFSRVGTAPRGNIAAWTATGALDPVFLGRTNGRVAALVVTPNGGGLVVGGSFSMLHGPATRLVVAPGLGAFFTGGRGEPVPYWASTRATFPIRNDDPERSRRGVTSLTTDGARIYGSSFNFLTAAPFGAFEGTFSIEPNAGRLLWMNPCAGDTHGTYVAGGVLFSAGHAHDCKPIGGFGETQPRTWHRGLAQTVTVDGVTGCGDNLTYYCYRGYPRSSLLPAFLPDFNTGPYSGARQGPWAVTGNVVCTAWGGEFTKVNGRAQQGLARFCR